MTCQPNKRQALLLIYVAILTLLGGVVLIADVIVDGRLHGMNALVGGCALVLACGLALPLRLREAIASVVPALRAWKGGPDA